MIHCFCKADAKLDLVTKASDSASMLPNDIMVRLKWRRFLISAPVVTNLSAVAEVGFEAGVRWTSGNLPWCFVVLLDAKRVKLEPPMDTDKHEYPCSIRVY